MDWLELANSKIPENFKIELFGYWRDKSLAERKTPKGRVDVATKFFVRNKDDDDIYLIVADLGILKSEPSKEMQLRHWVTTLLDFIEQRCDGIPPEISPLVVLTYRKAWTYGDGSPKPTLCKSALFHILRTA